MIEERFHTPEDIKEEIRRQFPNQEVFFPDDPHLFNIFNQEGIGSTLNAEFGIHPYPGSKWMCTYCGDYWQVAINVILEEELSHSTLFVCTPAQYEKMCITYNRQEWLQYYNLDTVTFIIDPFRCQAMYGSPEGSSPTIRELPRTVAQYINGWVGQKTTRKEVWLGRIGSHSKKIALLQKA